MTGIRISTTLKSKKALTENEEVISGPYDVVNKELKQAKKKVDKKELFEKEKTINARPA